jgi:arylsulfatase A-like enzyme
VVFENAIAPAPWTLASHTSMFTGLLPHQHGADWAIPLGGSPWTLAEILKSEGYHTAAFTANFGYGLKGWGYDQGFEVYDDNSPLIRHNLVMTYWGRNLLERCYKDLIRYEPLERQNVERVNEGIFRWFRHRPARPFFLFINYFDAHEPYLPPAPYDHKFGRISTPLLKRSRDLCYAKPGEPVPAQDVKRIISAYDNSLTYLDRGLDNLLQVLQRSRTLDNTIVIITSDHGEDLGDHQRFGHASGIYRELLHVPLIFLGAGIPQGLRVQHVAATRELFSTVLDLASPGKAPFHRRSLARFWRPAFQADDSDGFVISELTSFSKMNWIPTSISLFTPQWQYIHNAEGKSELYDWVKDPEEKVDLAGLPEYGQTVRDLQGQLQETIGSSLPPWRGPQHLSALDHPGFSFARNSAFSLQQASSAEAPAFRIGLTQAYFRPQASTPVVRRNVSNKDLLNSLPYH